jgi:hypothetical protein
MIYKSYKHSPTSKHCCPIPSKLLVLSGVVAVAVVVVAVVVVGVVIGLVAGFVTSLDKVVKSDLLGVVLAITGELTGLVAGFVISLDKVVKSDLLGVALAITGVVLGVDVTFTTKGVLVAIGVTNFGIAGAEITLPPPKPPATALLGVGLSSALASGSPLAFSSFFFLQKR